MKLLDKFDIQRQKQSERKLEVDEGAKLARRVDSLRELSAKEQVNLSKFRDESLLKLHNDVISKQAEIASLDLQIEDRRKVLEDLRKPLDVEWGEVQRIKSELETEKESVIQQSYDLAGQDRDIKARTKQVRIDELKVEDMFTRARIYIADAKRYEHESHEKLTQAEQIKADTVSEYEESCKRIEQRTAVIEVANREINIQRDQNNADAELNRIERIQLSDQRATLERAFNRLKK